jgi:Protein of unknown function (DUF1553)/Protein of unknown function (DUF1549)
MVALESTCLLSHPPLEPATVTATRLALAVCLALLPASARAGDSFSVDPPHLTLSGPAAIHTLLVESRDTDGSPVDRTLAAEYRSTDPGIVRVTATGSVRAVGDGSAKIIVTLDGKEVTVPVVVTDTAKVRPPHFENDIEPLLSRFNCNSSGCHGKAEGQNGFKLSVFGFDPTADHAALVKEGRGRRLFPAAPERSLLLMKMSGEAPHGGGARIRRGTEAYDILRNWITAGAPLGSADTPHVVSVRVEPSERILAPKAIQQLRVIACFSDGHKEDVTRHARFQTNNESIAAVDETGLITADEVPGEAAVMTSYLNTIAVCRILLPRPGRIKAYPDVPSKNFIDDLVLARLKKLNIVPSEVTDDATFLRRVYLDVIGTLPTPDEARRFLNDKSADKRAKLVDALLQRPEFADYWAMKWADLLRVDRGVLGPKQARAYQAWIREQFAAGVPLDRFARAVITAEGPLGETPPAAFYKAVEAAGKPGEAASALAQVFLGVRIACAQCHHHPFDRWGQSDYQGMAGYFTGLRLQKTADGEEVSLEGLAAGKHPRTGETILAHALGEKPPEKLEPGDQRTALAEWMTSAKNPFFARNLANRVWAHFLGRGLVEPVDDVRSTNPPTNPELLDALAEELIKNHFDLKALIRTITASRTYQLSTTPNVTNDKDGQNYSHALLRRVPAEVLVDMLSQTTGVPERFRGFPPGTRAIQLWDNKLPHYFLKVLGRPERASACECERGTEPGVAQVLHLLNAPEVQEKLSHAGGNLARLRIRHSSDSELVNELYLLFYSRGPDPAERQRGVGYLAARKDRRQQAIEDLGWSLLNTLEFGFNH